MGSQEIPEQRPSYWKNSIAGVHSEQLKKHREIENRGAFSYFNWPVTVPNLFLIFILLMSFIAPGSCTDTKTRINNAGDKIPSGNGGNVIQKVRSQSWTKGTQAESQRVIKITNEHATEYTNTVQMQGNWKTGSGSWRVITSESTYGEIADKDMSQHWTDSGSGLVDELKPRPSTIKEYLSNFEVVFVVDDSGSMKGQRWTETRDALATIAQEAFELKVDTVNVRFLNNASHVHGIQDKKTLLSLFDNVKPQGWTPLGRTLKAVFDEHLTRLDVAVREDPEKNSKILPLDIIVLTDGVPTDKGDDEPAKVIAKAVKRLNDGHYRPNTMHVLIVQIADDEGAKPVLKDLVAGDNGRIVDIVLYTGIVDSEKLQKILLRRVDPNIRA